MTTDTPTNTVAPNAPVIPAGYTAIGPTIHPRRIDKRNVPGLLLRHVCGPFVFFHDSTVCLCDQQWALEEAVNIAMGRGKGGAVNMAVVQIIISPSGSAKTPRNGHSATSRENKPHHCNADARGEVDPTHNTPEKAAT